MGMCKGDGDGRVQIIRTGDAIGAGRCDYRLPSDASAQRTQGYVCIDKNQVFK